MFAHFTRRTAIRITSYLTAAFVITIGAAMQNYVMAKQYELQLHNGYQQALQDLGTYVDNISVSLAKGMYAASPTQISSLSASCRFMNSDWTAPTNSSLRSAITPWC